ncbi:MAG: T9SS type A sorting domain-containing protein [Flavobacteriales bacterium]
MKYEKLKYTISTLLFTVTITLHSRENVGIVQLPPQQKGDYYAADCDPATSEIDLSLNNVRARILGGGDMWWDLNKTPQYEIPKNSGVSSLFAGALWIGGTDQNGNLKVAAMTYRQTGNDFWPGPISNTTVSTERTTCLQYDKHYRVKRKEVEDYVAAYEAGQNPSVPESMLNWPAHGSSAMGQDYFLAPFHDEDGDNIYNPTKGDYPNYDLSGNAGCDGSYLYGDETIWWIFNDVGNIHTETGGQAIGLQIKAQAFAFSTNDEINNMTFYNYEIENKSSFAMKNTYFGQWIDPDLGGPRDDYIGCDVSRGLGYCYNADDNDGADQGSTGYGQTPPAIGVDFFQGPKADANDGIDNDRDGQTDENGELIIMSNYMYYRNDMTDMGNPQNATHFYNYLKNIWKDGTHLQYKGNGWPSGGGTNGVNTNFAFPDDSDNSKFGAYGSWSQITENDIPADLRFIHSAGPFTLQSGQVNKITIGAVWARAQQGASAWASVQKVKEADDKAQALFDNCFKVLNGPDAPDLNIQEMENSLLLSLENKPTSNNYLEKYTEFDPLIDASGTQNYDSLYRFQGYQIFQLKDATVSASELTDPAKARLVAQCDLDDNVSQIINYNQDESLGALVPVEMAKGEDKGIVHSFKIEKDMFASGDDRLVNHKQYYYMAIAYGYNEYKKFSFSDPTSFDGQKKPFKAGRRNVKVYDATPHNPMPELGGTQVNASYGLQPKLTRVEGKGHGKEFINLSDETIAEILTSNSASTLTYANNGAPVNIKVIDPLLVPDGNFIFRMLDTITPNDLKDAYWMMIYKEKNDTVYAEKTIAAANEQIIKKWGLSVTMVQDYGPGDVKASNNGYVGSTMTFGKDGTGIAWLNGVKDLDGSPVYQDWIHSGAGDKDETPGTNKANKLDVNQDYEKIVEGIIAPYRLSSHDRNGPAWNWSISLTQNKISSLMSVDLVITADTSKWTRCPVLEMCDSSALTEGNAGKLDLRKSPSVDKKGNPDNSGTTGMGWFPGYAISVETGHRLNMAFGESSCQQNDHGRDMKWNPTNRDFRADIDTFKMLDAVFGGMHSIFVFQDAKDVPSYDYGEYVRTKLAANNINEKTKVVKDIQWVFAYPLANEVFGYIPSDAYIKIRVAKPYAQTSNGAPLPEFSFNTSDIKAMTGDNNSAKFALDKINIVPNPYYGYSAYEEKQLERIVKIVNLPDKCKIRIFTLNGTLVKTINKDDKTTTNVEWNLDNEAGVPIASGLYIIHVEVDGVGEKILKWFGVMRQTDLSTF